MPRAAERSIGNLIWPALHSMPLRHNTARNRQQEFIRSKHATLTPRNTSEEGIADQRKSNQATPSISIGEAIPKDSIDPESQSTSSPPSEFPQRTA